MIDCPNCKNPIKSEAIVCDWCNYSDSDIGNEIDSSSQPIEKGECLFFEDNSAATKAFYEVYDNFINIIASNRSIIAKIEKIDIFNIEPVKRYGWMIFFPLIGYLIRSIILFFTNYEKGFRLVSINNSYVIILKERNYQSFSSIMRNYLIKKTS